MLEFKPFKLEDKPLIDSYFSLHHYEATDECFTTLFMWQEAYGITWAEKDNVLFIRGAAHRDAFILAPFAGKDGSFEHGMELAREHFAETGEKFLLRGVSQIMKARLEELYPEQFTFEADRDNFEYIYEMEKMLTLPGKKLRQKKNHLNQFRMQYMGQYTYEPITKENMAECMDMARSWAVDHNDESPEEELESIQLLFDNWDALDVTGGLIRVYGKVEAFTIGEYLNNNMALIHIEKASPQIRGLYQAINIEYLKAEFPDVEFVNREEDMGIPGLRKAKESYQPVRFAEKYNAYPIKA